MHHVSDMNKKLHPYKSMGYNQCIPLMHSITSVVFYLNRSECDSKNVIFNLVLLIGIFKSSHDNPLWWMPQDLTDNKSTLVQVMAWCRQATSHDLSQCWLSSLSPYGVIRPQWVKAWMWYYIPQKIMANLSMLPWIFPGAQLTFRNIQGNLDTFI